MPRILFSILLLLVSVIAQSQSFSIKGRVADSETNEGVGFSYVLIPDLSLWAIADEYGLFTIHNVPAGSCEITVSCMGYEGRTVPVAVSSDVADMTLKLTRSSLKINDVVVVAQRNKTSNSTSYSINKMALDNQQVLNLSSVPALLPGGKTTNDNLTTDDRIALRSGTLEKGNASFGTAIDVDGVRMDNNAMMGETMSASTRSVAMSDVESVDIIIGIPSVEYGDLSNGIVKINLHKGKSPYVLESKINQSTSQFSLSKGFELRSNRGLLNVSFEHARSLKEIASPFTSYKRNVLSVRYANVFLKDAAPLNVSVGVTGNVGGYNSKQDPDNNLDSYSKDDERLIRVNFEGNMLLNKTWLTDLTLKANASFQKRLGESYTNKSSSSSQPYLHTREEGYHVAGTSPDDDIVLGPVGYWYVREFTDQRPVNINVSLKANRSKRYSQCLSNKLLVGAEVTMTGNNGRGRYYEDLALAPTWREYRYDELPWMYNMAFYVEDQLTQTFSDAHSINLTLGFRDDVTDIPNSEYGSVNSVAPRLSARYVWRNGEADAWVDNVALHAGWGRSIKLPSFQVLYPQETYSDLLTFTPGSTADNKAFYAYYTHVGKTLRNDDLAFQKTDQVDVGVEIAMRHVNVSLSGFYNTTRDPYQMVRVYSPLKYNYTSQRDLEGIGIPSAERTYTVDKNTGVVTVSGNGQSVDLPAVEHHTYASDYQYVNGSDVVRYGLEWIVDIQMLKWLSVRLDGNCYRYHGVDYSLIAGAPSGIGDYAAESGQQPLIGYYLGSNTTSAGSTSLPSVSNGSESSQLNQNATLTVRVPKARLIVMLKAEASFVNKKRNLSEAKEGYRGVLLEAAGDDTGHPFDGEADHYVALYPEYYSTWENPTVMIPFAQALAEAKDNDAGLYQQLRRLIVRSSNAYYFNANNVSPYCSFNLLVTKEMGNHIALSFYANNFLNTMRSVHLSQTGLDASLFGSGYVPKLYYGVSLKIKI